MKKSKQKRLYKDKPFVALQLDPKKFVRKIYGSYKLQRNWQIQAIQTMPSAIQLRQLAKRGVELKQKLQQLQKTLPDFVFSSASESYINELRQIRSVLKLNEFSKQIQVTHLRTNWTYEKTVMSYWGKNIYSAFILAKMTIQQYRRELKIYNANQEIVGLHGQPISVSRIGLTHAKPNTIYNIYMGFKAKEVFQEKRPMSTNKYIGIELEFCAPITKEALGLELLNNNLGSMVHLKTDGSLRPKPGETAFEVAFLVPELEYRPALKKLCDVLKKVGAETEGRRCGLHVHFDMRKRNKELIYNNLVSCQSVLWELIPPNRRNGEFCRSVTSRAFPKKLTGTREERYKSINAVSYYKHKTLEVRMHEGTTDFNEIRNWLMLLIKIVNYRKKLKNKINTVRGFNKKFKVNGPLLTYIQDRVNFWALNDEVTLAQPSRPTRNYIDEILGTSQSTMSDSVTYTLSRAESVFEGEENV